MHFIEAMLCFPPNLYGHHAGWNSNYGCCDETKRATMKAANLLIRCISKHRKSGLSNSVTCPTTSSIACPYLESSIYRYL
jgi:hypothetical protein